MIVVDSGRRLNDHPDLDLMLKSWFSGNTIVGSSSEDLAAYFASDGGLETAAAPAWRAREWVDVWQDQLLADLPAGTESERCRENIARLVRGEADVVITGQQPGFLGGPLYTLYKAASVIVLAEMRSAAGQPTIPVFWYGDDDDDLREAFRPVLYDPQRQVLLRGIQPAGHAERMLGLLPVDLVGAPEAAWLGQLAERNELASDIAALWQGALAEENDSADTGTAWGRLQRRVLLRVFQGSDLLTVSGNDGAMHLVADDFYRELWAGRERLRSLAQGRGEQLAGAGFHAQIGQTALERFLHLADGGRRHSLSSRPLGELPPIVRLRPGVAIRSLVQDWLFRPAGVVVGPGELAYLRQLEPLYEDFSVRRCPLLPRLFGQLLPRGLDVMPPIRGEEPTPHSRNLTECAAAVARAASRELASALREECNTADDRAQAIADRQHDRWQKAALSLLQQECERARTTREESLPLWVRPTGQRQERILASFAACALWGDELVAAVLHACRRHYDSGLDDNWREFHLAVPRV